MTDGRRWQIRNESPRRVELRLGPRHVELAPLERRYLTLDDAAAEAATELRAKDTRYVTLVPPPAAATTPIDAAYALLGVAVLAAPVFVIVGVFVGGAYWARAGALFAAALLAVYVLSLGVLRRQGSLLASIVRRVVHVSLLLGAVSIGLAIPGSALYFGTELQELVSFRGWRPTLPGETVLRSVLVGRALQFVLIAVASMFPALMYFQFDRLRLDTLRRQWVRHVLCLDKTVTTVPEVETKYRAQLEEAFGGSRATGRLGAGHTSPILLATLVLALGWVLILLNPDINTAREVRDALAQGGQAPGARGLIEFVAPDRSAVAYGFLGSYLFAMHVVLRSFLRGDLRPKTYNTITVRVLEVVILSWLLEIMVVGDNRALFVAAFAAGIVPETALRALFDLVPRVPGLVQEKVPLTELEGVDLYDRTRLADEGVTNVQALAHHDFLTLLLVTRIPVARLVDWLDQAILFLHVVERDDKGELDRTTLNRLRGYGIRTATDLIRVVDKAPGRDTAADGLLAALGARASGGGSGSALASGLAADGAVPRLAVAIEALRDDEWLGCVENWRTAPERFADPLKLDAVLDLRERPPAPEPVRSGP